MPRGIPGSFTICTTDGCTNRASANGLCKAHRMQAYRAAGKYVYQRRGRKPSPPKPFRKCMADGCEKGVYARGLCQFHYLHRPGAREHYQELRRQSEERVRALDIKCSIPKCNCVAVRKMVDGLPTLCSQHAMPHGRTKENEQKRRAHLKEMALPCTMPGCKHIALNKMVDGKPTLCDSHAAQMSAFYRNGNYPQMPLKQRLGSRCTICGYDLVTPDVHRLQAGGAYVFENTIALCPNCHRRVHTGQISVDELLRYKQG